MYWTLVHIFFLSIRKSFFVVQKMEIGGKPTGKQFGVKIYSFRAPGDALKSPDSLFSGVFARTLPYCISRDNGLKYVKIVS